LISADLGAELSNQIVNNLSKIKVRSEDVEHTISNLLKNELIKVVEPVAKSLDYSLGSPHILMLCGVNGNGKTTTAGKIASQLVGDGKKVMLVACDTFRAAAVEQLKIWADRTGSMFICGPANSDPASVAFKAIEDAKESGCDVIIIDTAGRLHNKVDLMNELSKIRRVVQKHDESAPHNTILVLDATTGQNALSQVSEFKKVTDLTGLIITKLDGTAKGGIVFAIAQKFNLPINAVGVGEGVDDLNSFDPKTFVDSIVS
jgi:fused signal recognition particle receptor